MYAIRTATVNDAATIRQLAEEIWWPTYSALLKKEQIIYMLSEIYSTEKITEQILTGSQTYLLLTEDELPVAFAAYSPREENAEIYKLHKLYCLPATQGKGYGKTLMDAVIEKVKTAEKNVLELNVQRHNKAKNFYEKMGFTIAYEEDIPFGEFLLTDYVMRREL
jgi:GNAT superfamily N-acetyltransferase